MFWGNLKGANKMGVKKGADCRKWDEMIPDVLALIFNKLTLQEKLTVIPRVCKSWGKAVEGPYCWQEIDIDEWSTYCRPHQLAQMLSLLLPRTSGLLQKLCVSYVDNDQMFHFIAQYSENLQTLILQGSMISDAMVAKVADKFPALTSLDMSFCCQIGARALGSIGKSAKSLSSLSWNMERYSITAKNSHAEEASAIAKTMPKLKRLELAYVRINTESVLEILSGCPELEYLDVTGCTGVDLGEKFLKEKYPRLELVQGRSSFDGEGDPSSWSWKCLCNFGDDYGGAIYEYLGLF